MRLKSNLAVSDTGFIFDPVSGESYSMNPIGAEIFSMMKNNDTTDSIKRSVLDSYDIDESNFEKDYFDFVSMLNRYNLTENE